MDFLNKISAVYDLFHPSSGYTLRYTPMYKENEETKNGKWPDGLVDISIDEIFGCGPRDPDEVVGPNWRMRVRMQSPRATVE